MKKLTLILLLISSQLFSQCPVKGDKENAKFQHIDSLKNRNYSIAVYDTDITLEYVMLPSSNDESKFNSSHYVHLTGYVIKVIDGGSETCNCHSKIKDDLDIHIEIALHPTDKGNQSMIVEINRFTKKDHLDYTTSNLKKLIGKKVEVDGWMFFDEEHKQNAVNTNPKGTNLWRATCWELHPCMLIKEVK